MKTDILNTSKNTKTVVALGKFDGLHIAHRTLAEKCIDIADKKNYDSCVYMLTGTGRVLCDRHFINVTLKKMGVNKLCEDILTKEYMEISPEKFVSDILFKSLDCAHVVVGYNYRYGKDRSGNVQSLIEQCEKFGIGVTVVKKVCLNADDGNMEVSSTNIRACLSVGNITLANRMLGRSFFVSGIVEQGKKMGAKLGFATANIYPGDKTQIPLKHGVYATKTDINGRIYNSVTNVGVNPTLENYDNIKIETHIFDFSDYLYGKEIKVKFVDFIRSETKFETVETLKKQMEKDILKAKAKLNIPTTK